MEPEFSMLNTKSLFGDLCFRAGLKTISERRSMLIVGNGRLITRDQNNPFIENGAVCIEGTQIKAVGTTAELQKQYPQAAFIDAHKGCIMPAFINTHHHIYSAFARGIALNNYSPKNFLDILDGLWWTLDNNLLLEDTKYSAYTTLIDCIKNGVTTVFDHHASYGQTKGSLFTIAEVAQELGLRVNLCYEVSDRNGEQKMKEAVAENADFIRACQKDKNPMQAAMMGLHASFTLSDKTLEYCAENLPAGTGYHIHVAEGLDDVFDAVRKYGKRVIHRLHDFNILGDKTFTVHCIHINPQEMELIQASNTMVVHNPESNMGNAVGCPPVLELFKRGILIGLGTDGYTSDMTESYKVANILHKHNTCDATAAWTEIPEMLFTNNAKIANRYFDDELGVLKAGASADVIVTDYNPLTPLHAGNVNGHILFGMTGKHTVTTIAAGKVLMKDRNLLVADEETVFAKAREVSGALWKRING